MRRNKKCEQNDIVENQCNYGYMDPNDWIPEVITPTESGKLAICVPTYQRAAIIEELLERSLKAYAELEFDLYIYDSNSDDDTYNVVKKWQDKGYTNLYHVRMPEKLHSNMKVYKIFQKCGLQKNYKYIWLCGDALRWNEVVLKDINDRIANDYDLILVKGGDITITKNIVYNDPLRFFKKFAWYLTWYGACLLRSDTMLESVQWEYYLNKYNIPERVNYSHLCFYFEKILTLTQFSALCIVVPFNAIQISPLKTASGWRKDTFYVLVECFPCAVNALPHYYSNAKKTVIQDLGKYSELSMYGFLSLRRDGLFDVDVYNTYEKKWSSITDIPRRTLKKIATMTDSDIERTLEKMGRQKTQKNRVLLHKLQLWRLKCFTKKYDTLYIYGAGKCAKRYACYLDEMGIDFDTYVVSDLSDNADMIGKKQVKALCDIDFSNKKTGVILGLNKKNQVEVKLLLEKYGIKRRIFDTFITP